VTNVVSIAAAFVSAGLVTVFARPGRRVRRLDNRPRTERPLRPRRFSTSRRRQRRLDASIPDFFELFVVSLQSGASALDTLRQLQPDADPSIAAAIAEVSARVDRGERFVVALDALANRLGVRVLGFVAALQAAERTGLALAPTIDRIADDARDHRRRLAEMEARRLPIRLSVPLVCCTLPSFIAIALGPIIIGALSSLRSL
jgi:tight adherence protein C